MSTQTSEAVYIFLPLLKPLITTLAPLGSQRQMKVSSHGRILLIKSISLGVIQGLAYRFLLPQRLQHYVSLKNGKYIVVQWSMPITPANAEAETGKTQIQAKVGQFDEPLSQNKKSDNLRKEIHH